MGVIDMGIMEDETAQTSAEFVLIFGGIMVLVIIALIVYQNYVQDMGAQLNNSSDLQNISDQLQEINSALN
ncbi:MAG TPA: class III signal peptide-containing protein [Methanobacterium sp.]|jgi:hypothetical protein|nr:class III signal peptide-containing protein [Methanobacterium sp.]HOI40677.1 class III signal peptide-containing protein [Methanobacterium sp.]